MPTYSYKCTECDYAFDIHQSFSDESLTVCPQCGGKLRKVFSPVGVTFKGSGFYRTDSRPDNSPSSAPAKKATTSNEPKPKSTNIPSKPASTGSSTKKPSSGTTAAQKA